MCDEYIHVLLLPVQSCCTLWPAFSSRAQLSSLEMSPLGYLGGLKGLHGQAPLGADEIVGCEGFPGR